MHPCTMAYLPLLRAVQMVYQSASMNNSFCGSAWKRMEAIRTFRVSIGARRLHTIAQKPTRIYLIELFTRIICDIPRD